MFHLSVPSAQTQQWLVFCRENGYLFSQAGILDLGEGQRGIPLLDSAPPQGSECWQGNSIVEAEGRVKGPTHWSERLPGDLQKLEWPNSYEIQGDLLIVKLEEELIPHEKAMAEAMLTQLPNIRLVCADEGVKGEFRVRDLRPILARDDNMSTMTRIRENGYSLWVDPAQVYFSIRLSNERIGTLEAGKKLANELDRPIVVADPYAGVGPSIAALLSQEGLLSGCYAGDLNPAAHELLEKNISGEGLEPFILRCADATKWSEREVADLLLVNPPRRPREPWSRSKDRRSRRCSSSRFGSKSQRLGE